MTERGARRGAGAPFYAPLRRKTSAEIISEARAAIYGEMSGPSGGGTGLSSGLRPLRTRRPYTPREPQRALYNERTQKKDARPPSGFELKFLTVSEGSEETLAAMEAQIATLDDKELDHFLAETRNTKSKPPPRQSSRPNQSQGAGDRTADSWSGFTKLPHLSGRSKPLHRRHNAAHSIEESKEAGLEGAISITRPLSEPDRDSIENTVHVNILDRKSSSSDGNVKHKQQYSGSRASSSNATAGSFSDISVKHIAVQLPNTNEHYDNLTVLELSEALSQRSRDKHRILQLLEALICKMHTNVPGSSLRELVLQALYKHIDSEDEGIQVAVARAMLTMRVMGPHLTVACKLVFKIAKNDKNDHFFIDTNLLELLVEGCGRLEPVSECECVVWGAAALRVLALEPRLAARAHTAGAAHLAALHLKLLNAAKAERPLGESEQITHAVFQVTGALRSLASDEQHAPHFLQSGALPDLVAALALYTDRDVLTNVARCLSVVSGWGACAAALCARCGAVVRALCACAPRAPLAVRLAYTLGNLAAAHARARNDIYDEEGAIDVLLMILETYTKRCIQGSREADVEDDQHLIGTDLGGSDGSDEDVLIKTVRVIANLCLTERAGRGLAANYAERTVKALLGCLQVAEKIIKDESKTGEQRTSAVERGEELATAALATLNNITYYREPPEPPDPLQLPFDEICKGVCGWVRYGGACGCEAVRALGNVSRTPRAARLLLLYDALLHLHHYLEHEEAGVRCAAAGVLVNVCGCAEGAGAGGRRAARALCAAARRPDPAPAPLLARALWNALAHPATHPVLEHALAREVTHALATFIDDDSVFAACEAIKLGDIEDEPELSKYQVTFDSDNNNYSAECGSSCSHKQGDGGVSEEDGDVTGEDLGFEDGEAEECACTPCRRLAAWDELVAVAIPLMEKLRPTRSDAAVGTD